MLRWYVVCVRITSLVDDGKLALLGLFEESVGVLERDPFLGGHQLLERGHHDLNQRSRSYLMVVIIRSCVM